MMVNTALKKHQKPNNMSKFCNLRYNLNNENGLVEIGFSIKPNFFQKIITVVVFK